jgi:hypothetical protein
VRSIPQAIGIGSDADPVAIAVKKDGYFLLEAALAIKPNRRTFVRDAPA